ncbi:heme-binding protein [Demequina flava]|uniref:heme-binding protein n=1 Tax=Demequina flava TaxID=1095025 RepID=UPI000781A53D|nr:heme-binding protein [Demequina flava]
MFTGITSDICAQAWDVITPSIERGYEQGLLNRFKGGVVVLDPADTSGPALFTAHLGEDPESFVEWATAKAAVAARTGMDTSRMRDHSPHLYRAGDIKWPGGIAREGLVVAFSGVQGEYDEMIAEWLVSAIRAICRIEFAAPDGPSLNGGPFLEA